MGHIRDISAIMVAIIVFFGIIIELGGFLIDIIGNPGTNSAIFSILRIVVLFISFLLASVAYYLIKGEKSAVNAKKHE